MANNLSGPDSTIGKRASVIHVYVVNTDFRYVRVCTPAEFF